MGKVLITGGSGFLGSALIPKLLAKGDRVIALVRNPEKAKMLLPGEVEIIEGDIIKPGLGVDKFPQVDKLIHLAAIHRLDESQAAQIWETNVLGTENVIRFCEQHNIPNLFFVSSAYVCGRNSYEKSKAVCESIVMRSATLHKTILKPSVIMPIEQQTYFGHFIQFALLVVKVHQRADIIRRYLEGKLRLPVIRPTFRVTGNPDGYLNLVSLDDVATAMAEIEGKGTFWLTNPNPPKLKELAEWVGEIVLVDIKIEANFKPTPIEAMFQKLSQAFTPYLWGDNFTSDIPQARPITKEFINATLIRTLLSS